MDFEHLAQPLASNHGPCGDDLVFSSEFDEIQEARRFDDPSLSQGEWVTDVKEADWIRVVRICDDILANKSKDLRVAAWLTEASCKLEGLGGLANGYTLLGRLCETFWNDIHPQPEDGDIEQRVGVLDWLANQTARLIRETPLTHSDKGRFSLIDHESARATAKNIERNPALAEELARTAHVKLETFDAALKDTPKRYFVDGMRNAERLKDSVKSLQTVLDAKMGEYSPAFSPSFEALDDVYRFFQRHAGDAGAKPSEIQEKSTNDGVGNKAVGAIERVEPSIGGQIVEVGGGPIRSREQAIRQLQEIGAFFRRTEPHSPVAYLAEKAAKWGTMPLHEWLRTVVKDDSALLRMEELLGVDPNTGESS